jgi:hypothetical protein
VRERLELRLAAAHELLERVRAPQVRPGDDSLAERAQLAAERAAALERLLAEREGLPPAARALAEEGQQLALAALEVAPGEERAVAAALGPRASALLAEDAPAALRLLERDRRVVAAIAGDTHRNSVERRGRLVLVTTSSLADWPQQARMFRLSARPDGGAVLETWTIDPRPTRLARISHQLAWIDYQGGRPAGDAGSPFDRRARIVIPPVTP